MPSFFRAVLRSYALLFFSQHLGFGGLLLLATFARPVAGALGLGATVATLGAARLLGFNKEWADRGTYSFNALLVGLLLGTWYSPSPALVGLVGVGAGLALLLSVALGGWLAGRGLPALSLPFVAVVWLLLAAAGTLPGLKLGDGGIYWLNDVYALGGSQAVAAAEWTQTLPLPPLLATYLRSLSSVVLQDSAVAGLLVGAGLLWHSRIAFTLSGLAFLAAYGVAWATGTLAGPVETFNLGANYMMAAIAVGCVFVVPSAASYGLALLTVPVTAVLLAGLVAGLAKAGLPALSLPYAVTALLFLYVLLLRERPGPALALTPVQRFSPEENLYAYVLDRQRLAHRAFVPLTLPVLGAWQVSQGYADASGPTHLGDWGAALDFVITDAEGRTFAGAGTQLTDFYAYGKPVLAPADGVVETVVQHIADNPIGTVNTADNWGNTVVLRHYPDLFTQLSHLKPHSVPVKPSDPVRRGDIIGYCGNSGRSPEPHVHFQVQATPYVGSRTLAYPLTYFMITNALNQVANKKLAQDTETVSSSYVGSKQGAETVSTPCLEPTQDYARRTRTSVLRLYAMPATGDTVHTPPLVRALHQAFTLPPGYALKVADAATSTAAPDRWEVFTDAYNLTYLRCVRTGAIAYFEHDEATFYFTAYYGSTASILYDFYLAAYRVPLVAVPGANVVDALPLTILRRPWLKFLQDVVAPFGRFVKPTFALAGLDAASVGTQATIMLRSTVAVTAWGRRTVLRTAEIKVQEGRLAALRVQVGGETRAFTFTPTA